MEIVNQSLLAKKLSLLFFIICCSGLAFSQNQIRLEAGFLSHTTAVTEFRNEDGSFYNDSVTFDLGSGSPILGLAMDVDLGKSFFLTTGFFYTTKGPSNITYTTANNEQYSFGATQQYLGLSVQAKYHKRIGEEKKWGVFIAFGVRVDVTVGDPSPAVLATGPGAVFMRKFGTLTTTDISLATNIGFSYKAGPGDLILSLNLLSGLGDIIADPFIVGRTSAIGATIGYSFYLR
jgi:outer membrane protein with beta-barrel domain